MKCNQKYNCKVSFMDTTNQRNQQEKYYTVQLVHTKIVSKTNTEKSQGNESVLGIQLRGRISSLDSDQKYAKHISEESAKESEVPLIKHRKYNTKNTTHMQKEKLNYLQQNFQ